jgi:uncharacterized protein YutE (UPF0331/DUF86 family)
MDREVIEQKLESLRRCLQRVEEKCPSDPAALTRDLDLQDIVTLNLTRAVQLCVDLGAHLIAGMEVPPPDTMGETFDVLAQAGVVPERLAQQLKRAVGFRNVAVHHYNVAVHHYDAIDWTIVHRIAGKHLSDFNEFAGIVAARLD